ncbi:MAG: hypothetical protein H6552_04265 [Chitinophagales bacterium]|nr:hypothetical protein [Chitinophagales bacterium]
MIFAFEKLNDFENKLITAMEPFIDFSFSLNEKCCYFQTHHLIIDGKDIYTLRLHKAENLKQGLICTDFEEAKWLSMFISGADNGIKLKEEYPWLEDYLLEQKDIHFINLIALPISEYIKYYANNFKQLRLIDFKEMFSFRNY